MHFRALEYNCLHVVHTALWSNMWSKLAPLKSTSGHLKIGLSITTAVVAASRKNRKNRRTKHGVVSPKVADQNMWSYRTQTSWSCGRKPLRVGKRIPISRAFLLPPVSYCNLEKQVCQVLKITFPLPK